ncbi:MAG: BLUF domain-containing protein [Rhodobacteraceae bacterium]|nr:BLUF domain-containing protein [Paracoccaceae bacterium]MCW9042094.1 BLUF domain-containing protein [Pseudopelagicola sp.]
MPHQLLYGSVAVHTFPHPSDFDILRKSHANNAASGMTGFLIRTPVHFLQLLEGRKDAIDAAMMRIRNDDRHLGLRIFYRGEAAKPSFDAWEMGFAGLDDDRLDEAMRTAPENDAESAFALIALMKELSKERHQSRARWVEAG